MSEIKLTADGGGGSVSLKGPATTTGNQGVNLKLPVADGSANQVLKTDGSGQLSFTTLTDTDTIYNDSSIRRDLNTLALQTAVDTNRKAYNLQNSFIDQFEDSTGIGSTTTASRHSTEYISSATEVWDANLLEGWDFEDDAAGDSTGVSYNGVKGLLKIEENTNLGQQLVNHSSNHGGADPVGGVKALYSTSYGSNGDGFFVKTISGQTSPLNFGSGAFTLEGWVAKANTGTPIAQYNYILDWANVSGVGSSSGGRISMGMSNAPGTAGYRGNFFGSDQSLAGTDWNIQHLGDNANLMKHFAFVRDSSGNSALFFDGTRRGGSYANTGGSVSYADGNALGIFTRHSANSDSFFGFLGSFRISNNARYDPTSSTYTKPTSAFSWKTTSTSATGTVVGVANTASSSRTKVSGTFLYKNASGTATIGTDLKIYFTCNGGTNWTEAASYTAGSDFSTGIKTIYLGETTCTAGTDVRYKAVWANQAAGSKVTEVHGIGVNY